MKEKGEIKFYPPYPLNELVKLFILSFSIFLSMVLSLCIMHSLLDILELQFWSPSSSNATNVKLTEVRYIKSRSQACKPFQIHPDGIPYHILALSF